MDSGVPVEGAEKVKLSEISEALDELAMSPPLDNRLDCRLIDELRRAQLSPHPPICSRVIFDTRGLIVTEHNWCDIAHSVTFQFEAGVEPKQGFTGIGDGLYRCFDLHRALHDRCPMMTYVHSLEVNTEFLRRGIGSRLVKHVVRMGKGFPLYLCANPGLCISESGLFEFYTKNGFKQLENRSIFYHTRQDDKSHA